MAAATDEVTRSCLTIWLTQPFTYSEIAALVVMLDNQHVSATTGSACIQHWLSSHDGSGRGPHLTGAVALTIEGTHQQLSGGGQRVKRTIELLQKDKKTLNKISEELNLIVDLIQKLSDEVETAYQMSLVTGDPDPAPTSGPIDLPAEEIQPPSGES